jgi:hypothetical protein
MIVQQIGNGGAFDYNKIFMFSTCSLELTIYNHLFHEMEVDQTGVEIPHYRRRPVIDCPAWPTIMAN